MCRYTGRSKLLEKIDFLKYWMQLRRAGCTPLIRILHQADQLLGTFLGEDVPG